VKHLRAGPSEAALRGPDRPSLQAEGVVRADIHHPVGHGGRGKHDAASGGSFDNNVYALRSG
jgi:hypothetical protein